MYCVTLKVPLVSYRQYDAFLFIQEFVREGECISETPEAVAIKKCMKRNHRRGNPVIHDSSRFEVVSVELAC